MNLTVNTLAQELKAEVLSLPDPDRVPHGA